MVDQIDDERFEFSIYLPNACNVELAADFTGWGTPLAMRQDDNGWWRIRATVPAGDHEFCYYVNGHSRMPDYAAHGVRVDKGGRLISLLCVEGPEAAA